MPSGTDTPGFPPKEVTVLLRVEGLVVFVAALYAYQALGGNWWIFALLILAPDLAMLGTLVSAAFGARAYNGVHTYTIPAIIGAVAWLAGTIYLVPFVVIWIAHIGADRALGYGLKYPGTFHQTHLGLIGKARKAQKLADAG
jgi:uncharacterized membrane protein